jgi:hypothetical protein
MEELFWNRLVNTPSPVTIDFGDGPSLEQIDKETYHTFEKEFT